MSEIAIISTREVIYEPFTKKQAKIKITLKTTDNFGMWNLDIKYFAVYPKVEDRPITVQIGVDEETNEPIYEQRIESVEYQQIEFIKGKTLNKTNEEIKNLFQVVGKTIQPDEFPDKYFEIQNDALLMYVQNDHINPEEPDLSKRECILGVKPNEWVIYESN